MQGYGTFKAGVLSGAESCITSDPKTSTAQRKTDRRVDTPDEAKPNIPPKPVRSKIQNEVYSPNSDRSSSPKPLTSNPPSSVDVRKPLPKAPVSNSTPVKKDTSPFMPNYENQSELDRYQHKPTGSGMITSSPPCPPVPNETSPYSHNSSTFPDSEPQYPPSATSKERKSQQFSLKAWLKREREQVRKGVDSDAETPPEPKGQSSMSFSRFKNSMMQKLSTGSSSKKHENNSKKPKDLKQTTSPDRRYDNDSCATPYEAFRNSHQTKSFTENPVLPPRDNAPFPSVESDPIISPIDDPDADDILSPEVNKYQHQSSAPLQTHKSQSDCNTQYRDSDVNNNGKYGVQDKPYSAWQPRGDDTPYGRVAKDKPTAMSHDNKPPNISEYIGTGAESKRVVGQAAPVYNAVVLNNYGSQGKFETPNIPRQNAEPAKHMHFQNDFGSKYGSPRDSQASANHSSRYPVEHIRAQSSDDTLRDRQQNAGQNVSRNQNQNENSPYGQIKRNVPLDNMPKPETPRKKSVLENRNYLIPGNRVPMNVQSIGSLIDKFDKYNNNSNQNGDLKPETTSTPVAARRAHVLNGDVTEVSPPLPPRSPAKSHRTGEAVTNTTVDLRPTSRYSSPDRQGYYTPPSRPSHSQMSPPSTYSTPHGNHSNITSPKSKMSSTQSQYTAQSNDYFSSPQSNAGFNSNTEGFGDNMKNYNSFVKPQDEREDGYRARLRRAANNNQSAFDKFSKASPLYTGRPSYGSPYEPYGSPAQVNPPKHNDDEVSYMAI